MTEGGGAPDTPDAAAQPGASAGHAETVETVSDPSVLKALAHPLRIELLSRLDDGGEATASELAESTGQTVANASFHLRQLEKAGLIVRAEARGREKPWRAAHHGRRLRPAAGDQAAVRDVGAIAAAYVQHEAARLTRFLLDEPRTHLPVEWVEAVTVMTGMFWATAPELAQLAEDVHDLLERFAGRRDDPSQRPDGAVPAHFFGAINPDVDASEPGA